MHRFHSAGCGAYDLRVLRRALILVRARLTGMWLATFAETAPLWLHAILMSVLCMLVRGELSKDAYALLVYSFSGLLLAVPLLGEFGAVLRDDSAREWVEALPVRRMEIALARVLLLLASVCGLAFAALLPAALIASEFTVLERVELLLSGLAQGVCFAAFLLALQSALRGALEGVLVLLQTTLVAGAIIGAAVGLKHIYRLQELAIDDPSLAWFPPSWFVLNDWRFFAAMSVALLILLLAPSPPAVRASNRKGLGERLLTPLRALATRSWVRKDERAAFDLVYDALPREREFVLRTYPMIALPLAFLLLGVRGESGVERDAGLAVLLFTPAAYVSILLTHIPATRSPEAGWLLETAPISPAAIANGALKAVAVRFLLPVYLALSAISVALAGWDFSLRVAVPGALLTLIMMRRLFPTCVLNAPLSRGLSELEHDEDLAKSMFAQALVLPILGIAVWRLAEPWWAFTGLTLALLALELVHDRRWRATLVADAPGGNS